MPAIAFGSGAADAQVASQVADSILTELINKDVGQGALDDAAKVKCRRRSQGRRASRLIEDHYVRQPWNGKWVDVRRLHQSLAKRPVITSCDQRRQHSGIDTASTL